MSDTLNELLKIARHNVAKQAFVDAATAGGGGMPMDPAMMGGGGGGMPMDPAAMGGAPAPTDPAAASAGGGGDPALSAKLDQLITMMGQGGAGGAGGAGLKPKIDVNVALMQISKMLARIADALGVQIPAAEMIATPQDLGAMAQQQSSGAPGGGGMPAGGAGGAGGSAISPISPMQGASPALAAGGGGGGGGEKTSSLQETAAKAAALSAILGQQRGNR